MFKLSKSHKLDLLAIYKKARHIYDDVPHIRNKRFKIKAFKFLKYFSYIALAFFVIYFVLFIAYFKDFKIFYESALSGKKNIEKSVELITAEQFKEGKEMAKLAKDDFGKSVAIANKYQSNFLLKHISYFRTQIDDVKYLVLSAQVISEAVSQAAEFAETFETILARKSQNFNQLSTEDKKKLLEIIYTSSPELTGIKANIDLALINLDNIGYSGVLLPFKQKLLSMEGKLLKVQSTLEAVIPMSNFVPVIMGYPEKASFLFILQNSDELRPTGGFIGTYGILETEYGDFLRMDTHDVYHMDMPVKDTFKKTPPEPLKKYLGVNNWYLRDANWSPDWPSSARLIQQFYHEEDALLPEKDKINRFSGDFDGVIAITPGLITDLLAYIGPVYIQGQEFNQHNFVELLQYKVEQEYIKLGTNSWHRKAIIGEIVKELKIKLFDLDPVSLYKVLDIFQENLTEKNILLYFNDRGYEEITEEKGWAGNLVRNDSDYLMVVDANMASYKTDAVIKRGINYKMEQSGDGAKGKLQLNYSHHGSFDWKTTRYQTYTRVYVPKGSKLTKIEGVEGNKADVYDEFDRTVIAFFLKIEPGQIGNVAIGYDLPAYINKQISEGAYSVYIQKQPGNDIEHLSLGLDFQDEIKSYKPTGFFATKQSNNSLKWDSELFTDRVFSVELNR